MLLIVWGAQGVSRICDPFKRVIGVIYKDISLRVLGLGPGALRQGTFFGPKKSKRTSRIPQVPSFKFLRA